MKMADVGAALRHDFDSGEAKSDALLGPFHPMQTGSSPAMFRFAHGCQPYIHINIRLVASMNLKLRLSLLLGLLLIAFLAALFVLRTFERQQSDELLARVRQERLALLNRWLETSGLSLRQFADDYAQWSELVRFVETPDPAWARANIEADLSSFNAQAVWVMQPDGSLVYSVSRLDNRAPMPPPLTPADFAMLVGSSARPHFFLESRSGLLEIRGAPISTNGATTTGLHGWLLVARLWDDAYLKNLADLTESTVALVAPDDPSSPPAAVHLILNQSLDDWRGQPLRTLIIDYDASKLHEVLAPAMFQARIFVAFGLLMIAALSLSLQRWVLRPLNLISDSLKRSDTAPISPLLQEKSELGGVARLIKSDFEQREALRQSEESLRHTLDEHERLGRDLHDGVIQSLYATGLGLAGIRALVHTDPAEAEERLEQTRHALNETIRDVRNFINGLEPEALKQQTFTHAVEALIEFRKSVRPFRATIEIDENLAARLTHEQRVHALQITREAVSNALRHGQATLVTIALRPLNSRGVELSITDDGSGFDPLAPGNGGIGLQSFAERARELDANLSIESAAEKGTRVKLTFILPTSTK
jgi:signal transduction histidine kinase